MNCSQFDWRWELKKILDEQHDKADLLQIALGFIGAGMNGGFLQSYILQREMNNNRVIRFEELDVKAKQVFEELDDLTREAQRGDKR
jgi:hypothetical protein